MLDIKGEYKITLPPNPVFSGNRKIGKYFNRKIFLPTGGRHPRSLAPVTDIGANTYRPLATAHTLAPVVPVCFNLFRVMIPTPQRNTGGQATHGATTDRRATARPLAPVTDIGANTYRPLATAHRLAPVAPVCFNLFRVITYQPQRDTGDRRGQG